MSEFFLTLIQSGIVGQTENETLYTIAAIILVVFSYLVGSVNFCRLASYKLRIDNEPYVIVEHYGRKIFLYYFLDGLKGFVCSFIGFILMPGAGYASLAMIFCLLGHGAPIYFGFKAKGSAGTLAMLLGCGMVINPVVSFGAFIVALIVYFALRYISLCGVVYIVLFAFVNDRIMMWQFARDSKNFVSIINTVLSYGAPFIAMLIAILLFVNGIARLIRGKEEKTYFKKLKKE